MRIASRTARRFDTFDRRFDQIITPILLADGFSETRAYVFTRLESSDPLNGDIIYFDVEAASMIVEMGFTPHYMKEIDEFFVPCRLPNDPGIAMFCYVAPVRMVHRPRLYGLQPAARRDRTLDTISHGLQAHALAWLRSLRDPIAYADAVAPTALMCLGGANEWAGRRDRAMEAYEEMMRRYLVTWNDFTFRAFVEGDGARVFVYLCLKLGREMDKCELVMDAIKYCPKIAPFGAG